MSTSLFTSQVPALLDVSEGTPVTVGITLTFSVAGTVSGARVYAPATVGAGTYEAALWRVTADDTGTGAGTLLATATFGALTPGTWNSVAFSSPQAVDTTHAYVIGLRTSAGRYTATGGLFGSAIVNAPITGPQDGAAFPAGGFAKLNNGRFTSGLVNYPTSTFGSNGYFIDVLFDPSGSDVLLAATLTANGNLTAALAPQPRLSAAFTANGNLSVALASSGTSLSASLSANASLSAAFTVPTGPADPIATPVAEKLLACFSDRLAELPKPPKYIQMRVGQQTGPLEGPNVDECCSGLAWVRIAGVFPSSSFPSPDSEWSPCGPLAYAVQLEMGMAFCMPWSDSESGFDNVDPPGTSDWASAAVTQQQHQNLMRQTAACCFVPPQRRMVGEWSPLPVEGGCTGGTLVVTVSVINPCSDC